MSIPAARAAATIFFFCTLVSACVDTGSAPGPEPVEETFPRVWVDRDVARTVDLTPFFTDPTGTIEIVSAGEGVTAAADGRSITLTPEAGFVGDTSVELHVRRRKHPGYGVLPIRVKDGSRRCETVFRWSGTAGGVYVAGAWNGFSTVVDPLVPVSPGEWEIALTLPAGDHPYKLVVNGEWLLDPTNPLTMWEGGTENSRARVPDCSLPRLDLFDVTPSADGFAANVTFVSAEDGAAIDGEPEVTLDGLPWSGSWDAATRVLAIEDGALAPGKHLLEVTARDDEGRDAETLRVPFWVEESVFDWRDAIAYFVLVDRFRNGDASNDASTGGTVQAPADWSGGDWAGVLEAIEEGYFEDLGVNVLWLSPHVDNPDGAWPGADGRDYSGYHGYWPKAPRGAEEHFGDVQDLRAVVDAAHARGMRVLLDLVVNHVHEESPYWTDDPGTWFHDLYVCGWEQPITCWFTDYLPDLDFTNRDVLQAQVDDARWWLEQTGADGFRVDALKHFQHVVGRTLRAEVAAREAAGGSRFYMVGETFVGQGEQALLAQYVSPQELDGQFDFPLYWEILRTIGRGEGTLHDLEAVIRTLQGYYAPTAVMGTFLGNHDVPRFLSHADGDISDLYGTAAKEQGWTAPPAQPAGGLAYARMKTAFTILFALPGMPTIYYGDEVALAGAGDPDNRRPMPWTGLSAEQVAVREHVAVLAAARSAHPELARGSAEEVWVENDLLVLERRWQDGETTRYAYLAINRGGAALAVEPDVAAPDGTQFEDVLTGTQVSVAGGSLLLSVPENSAALYVTP